MCSRNSDSLTSLLQVGTEVKQCSKSSGVPEAKTLKGTPYSVPTCKRSDYLVISSSLFLFLHVSCRSNMFLPLCVPLMLQSFSTGTEPTANIACNIPYRC